MRGGASGFTPALGFHVLTPLYDCVVAITTRERTFKRALLDQASIAPGQQLLDVGCGTGTLAIAARRRQLGLQVSEFDADPAVLAIAVRKARRAAVDITFELGRVRPAPCRRALRSGAVEPLLPSPVLGRQAADGTRNARVLRPGGELHVADWGRAGGLLSRSAFLAVQLLDGFDTTSDNVTGLLPVLFGTAGFRQIEVTRRIPTALGIVSLYRAVKGGAASGLQSAGGTA